MYREILFGKLSSSFFHDLITPLNTIHILLTTPQENPASVIRKCKESSEKINFYIHRYRELIKNPENSEWFNIQREIGHVATLLKTTAQVHNIDIIEQTESSIIYGNKSIFVQIIANIVSNAIDSHKENNTVNKRITIRAKKDRSKIKIIIKDNGKGIPEHLLRNIFEYSFTTKQNLGCGIGLSYVKEHLKKFYSGHISCTSKENKGTTFQIHFPIHPGGHATSRDVQSGDDHTHEHRTNEFLF
jgi:signal transduction histidine kinase